MADGARRSETWYQGRGATDGWRVRLVINELDEFEARMNSADNDMKALTRKVNAKLNTIVALMFTILVAVIAALASKF